MKITESVLFKTSAASDVQCSAGNLQIAGCASVRKNDIAEIVQIKSKEEVVQVVTVGGTSYTPVASTDYIVLIGDTNRQKGGVQEQLRKFVYTTPATLTDIGADAAEQREAIHLELVAKINAANGLYVTAATLGTGTGFTVTDDSGYYPAFSHSGTGRLGASTVITAADPISGLGFADNYTTTTAAVYASGVGATLASGTPVVDAMAGGLLSGYIGNKRGFAFKTVDGDPAVSGQNYDIFVINALKPSPAHNQTGQLAYVPSVTAVAVDNGTGSSTTNLTGFLAFEKVVRRHIADLYKNDKNSTIEFFDSPAIFQGAAGAVPTTTGENKMSTAYGQLVYNNIGTNTITVPTPGNTGLLIDQDLTDTEGAEYTPSLLTVNPQGFVVGKADFSFVGKVIATDFTDAKFLLGFRKKAAHAAAFDNYTDLAAAGFIGDDLYTWGILNNAATVATDTTAAPTDSTYQEFHVAVNAAGLVTVKINGTTYPVYSAGTTALTLDAGDEMIPFFLSVNVSGGDPDVVMNQAIAVAGNWLQ